MKWLHAIAHFLGVSEWYYDTLVEDGYFYRVKRCPTCNAISDKLKLGDMRTLTRDVPRN